MLSPQIHTSCYIELALGGQFQGGHVLIAAQAQSLAQHVVSAKTAEFTYFRRGGGFMLGSEALTTITKCMMVDFLISVLGQVLPPICAGFPSLKNKNVNAPDPKTADAQAAGCASSS